MSKKNADREKEEEKDLDEEEEDDETEDDEEEVERPVAKAAAGRARPRARAAAAARPVASSKASDHDDHGHDEDDDEEDDEEDDSDVEDAYWWTPHAVMSALVLLGVLGFFGAFNKVLAGIAAHPAAAATTEKAPEKTTGAATPPPPMQRPGAGPAEQREEFGAKHLLVQFKGSTRAAPTITRTDDEAKARATEALKKAKSGAKFEDLVKEYSDEPGAGARGGDLGKFRKGRMDPVFQGAVEKLKVGEVSDLVKTQFGYHIILRTQ